MENQEESQRGRGLNLEDREYYGKIGHKKKDYWNRKKNGDIPDGDKEENVVSNKSEEDALLLSLESVDDSLVLDSSALFHATPHRGYFINYVQGDFGHVYLGDNEPCQSVRKGKVKIKL